MEKRIGIDLGTTYSRVSYVDEYGMVRLVESVEGGYSIPSVVCFDPDTAETMIGSRAKTVGAVHPEYMIGYVKN